LAVYNPRWEWSKIFLKSRNYSSYKETTCLVGCECQH